jgi:lipoprotein-releasing system permease protein
VNVALLIAKRYLRAKKSHNLINIISLVSVIGITIGTMGLIIVLSVFNGFGKLVVELYNSFDPDIRITPVEGKTFEPSIAHQLAAQPFVKAVIPVLEENALLRYRDRQSIVTLKGVSDDFPVLTGLKSKLLDGRAILNENGQPMMIAGGQIAYALGLRLDDPFHSVAVYLPRKDVAVQTAMMDPSAAFSTAYISPSGVFGIQQDFDAKYVVVPISFIRSLTSDSTVVTALEVMLKNSEEAEKVIPSIKEIAGDKLEVKGRAEQHAFLYKILRTEKVAVYLILGFILLIATFNLLGSFAMLIIDKREDLEILKSMGADKKLLQRIFLFEGLMISFSGALVGLFLGGVLCAIQQFFGVIRLENGEGFVTESYPVDMQVGDFVIVALIVFLLGYAASWYTSHRILRRQGVVQ